ncbi:hypothetical protein EON80_07290, partial [bacterium]
MKTKNFRCLSLLGALGVAAGQPVMAQGGKAPRLVAAANDTVKIGIGERVTLPYANVTRIITDDDEVARAFFQSGNAILEGASSGTTTVEVYQANGTPKVLTVIVENSPSPQPGPVPETPVGPGP